MKGKSIVICLLTLSLKPVIYSQFVTHSADGEILSFPHETCSREIYHSFSFTKFHNILPFVDSDGSFELRLRFRGVADGHILLSPNPNTTEPLYMIIIGSYNNRYTEIRRTKQAQYKARLSTPGILSKYQWRGFTLRFQPLNGTINVMAEGRNVPLLSWHDPDPIQAKFFSFSTYKGRLLEVAFNCTPKDMFSTFSKRAERYSHNKCGTHWTSFILGGWVGMLTVMAFFGLSIIFAAKCDTHLLIQLFPEVICNKIADGTLEHGSLLWTIGMALANGLICTFAVSSSFFALTLGIPSATLIFVITRELRTRAIHLTKKVLREWGPWLLNYKALQILIIQINISIGYPVLHLALASVMVLHIVVLTTSIINGHQVVKMQHFAMLFVQSICIFIYFCFLSMVALITQNLKMAAEEKKKREGTKHNQLYLSSLFPSKYVLGHFTYINPLSTFNVINIVINKTVDLAIMIKS